MKAAEWAKWLRKAAKTLSSRIPFDLGAMHAKDEGTNRTVTQP
jgi:TPR repeat protein